MTTPVTRWVLARMWPFARAATLHRAALEASAAGDRRGAALLLARAARAYRKELRVEALARLRVHERMMHWRESCDEALAVEIERRLARLDLIESLDPPFRVMPAHEVMGAWRGDPSMMAGAPRAA